MRIPLLALLSAGLCTCPASEPQTSGGYRGPTRNNIYPATGLMTEWPADGLQPLWSNQDAGMGFSSPLIVGDRAYVLGSHGATGKLKAFDLTSGKQLWESTYGEDRTAQFPGPRSSLESDGQLVFFTSSFGQLHAFALADGKQAWTVDIPSTYGGAAPGWGYSSTPLRYQTSLIIMGCASKDDVPAVVSVEAATGKPIWSLKPGPVSPCSYASPILINTGSTDLLIVPLDGATLVVDPVRGRELSRVEKVGGGCMTPLWQNGILICSGNRIDLEPDGSKATVRWTTPFSDDKPQAVLLNERLYGYTKAGWTTIEATNGKTIHSLPCQGVGPLFSAGGMVFWVSAAGPNLTLTMTRPVPTGLEVVGKTALPVGRKEFWASPVLAGTRLVMRHGTRLTCFDLAAK